MSNNQPASTESTALESAAGKGLSKLARWGILAAIVIVVVVVLIAVKISSDSAAEKNAELADLAAMRAADVSAQVLLANGQVTEMTVYWYDAEGFELVSEANKPSAYGLGTATNGGSSADYNAKYGTSYAYDDAADYTDKVVKVTVDPSAADGEQIVVEWVK